MHFKVSIKLIWFFNFKLSSPIPNFKSLADISNKQEIKMLNKYGVNAYLIGEGIIKNNNIIDSTKELIE